MSTTGLDECCRGTQLANTTGEFAQDTVWEACREAIRDAIELQLSGEQRNPVVIDGLPTIGKTQQATEVASMLDAPIAILTHRYETRDEHLELAEDRLDDYTEIPTLDRDCPTGRGENGQGRAERIRDLRARGASPTYLHYHLQEVLPCMQNGDCPYIQRWDEVEDAQVIVGGPAHAALEKAVEDRVVIFDEDPGQTFRVEFNADQLANAISTFLSENGDLPIDNQYGLIAAATNESESMVEIRETIREVLLDSESIARPSEAIRDENGHAEAPSAILAMLDLGGPIIGNTGSDSYEWSDELRETAELDYVDLPDGAQVVYDHAENRLIIRRPPSLGDALAVVGLDGTPVEELWRGRLGVDDVDLWRVLCDECRGHYLRDVIGYRLVQTAPHVKPYSGGRYVNRRADYGLIEAVANRHEVKPGVITTKTAEERLFEENPEEPFIDRERVKRRISDVKHYGALRSSNEFEGTEVGIVIGSPHPGDRPIQITAALEGHTAVRQGEGKGTELDYGIPGQPFLQHFRENKVAQAVFRFGRTSPATVYVHTGVLPDWLAKIVEIGPDSIEIAERSEGQRAVIRSLIDEGAGTAAEIAARKEVPIGEKHTRDCLKQLKREGYVTRSDTQPYIWFADGLSDAPHTALVLLPDEVG